MILVDTSVLVAYLCPEPLHGAARRGLDAQTPRALTPLIRLEAASALGIKTRTGEMTPTAAQAVLNELDRQVEAGVFEMHDVDPGQYRAAFAWLAGFATQLRALDALHLAAARELGAKLLTADRGLAKAAKLLDVPCQLIG